MNKRTWIVIIAMHALLLITVYVFQGMIFPYVRIIGFIPLLLPIVSTGIAVNAGCHTGGIAGLFSGILCDASFHQPPGTFTILLTFTGLFIGALFDSVIVRGFVTYFISCLLVLILSAGAQIFTYFMFDEAVQRSAISMFDGVILSSMTSIALRQTGFSIIFAFPIWFFVRALGRRMDEISSKQRPL